MAKKQTREELVAEVARLNLELQKANELGMSHLNRGEESMKNMRKQLYGLLGGLQVQVSSSGGYPLPRDFSPNDRTVAGEYVPSWIEIAGMIGELKADANYSVVLQQVENLRRELGESDQKLACNCPRCQ